MPVFWPFWRSARDWNGLRYCLFGQSSAIWECFGNAFASFIVPYKVAYRKLVQNFFPGSDKKVRFGGRKRNCNTVFTTPSAIFTGSVCMIKKFDIAGFHCHAITQKIKYSKILAKIQVSAVCHMRDIQDQRNDLPKLIELCMRTPRWYPSGWATTWLAGNQQKHLLLDSPRKREFISWGLNS